jgi:predicted transcriptional regulator/DNA-binding CsgD family transcriptional regulator
MDRDTVGDPDAGSALDAIGVRGLDEDVYRAIVGSRDVSPADLAERLGVHAGRVRRALDRLRDLGLVSRLSGRQPRYTAAAPETAVETLVRSHIARLEQVRSVAAELDSVFHSVARAESSGVVDVLDGASELGRWFVRLEHQVREEMLVLDRPPYALAASNPVEPASLARGVRWRAIYSPEALEAHGALSEVRMLATRGEEGRVLPGLRAKLAIADRRVALMPLGFDLENMRAVLIRESVLLDTLVDLFETYWARAVPLDGLGRGQEPSLPDRDLLTLLVSGFKDDSIARQLGISTRTMRRRIRVLMDELSADNRFQAGVQAARRGWI